MLPSVVRMLLTVFIEELARSDSSPPLATTLSSPLWMPPDPAMLPPQCPLWLVP
jgi:hypothetical protein